MRNERLALFSSQTSRWMILSVSFFTRMVTGWKVIVSREVPISIWRPGSERSLATGAPQDSWERDPSERMDPTEPFSAGRILNRNVWELIGVTWISTNGEEGSSSRTA
jgi:hypothetical protein